MIGVIHPNCECHKDKPLTPASDYLARRNSESDGSAIEEAHKIVTELGGLPLGLDQQKPLTPKDVGLTKAECINGMLSWWSKAENRHKNRRFIKVMYEDFENLSDEEFDRLYQEFLKEKLTNK